MSDRPQTYEEMAREGITDENSAVVFALLAIADAVTIAGTRPTLVVSPIGDGAEVARQISAAIKEYDGVLADRPRGMCGYCDHPLARHLPVSGVCGVKNCGCSQAES